jgi:Protein of unknown function (DUF4244)
MTTTTNLVALSRVANNQAISAAEQETDEGIRGTGLAVRPGSRIRRVCERGMISAEWAVGLIAAIAIAGVLVSIVTSGAVRDALLNIVLSVIAWIAHTLGGVR